MDTKNPILDELEIIAPMLFHVPRTFLYSFQSGYFDNLADNILIKIKANNLLKNKVKILGIDLIPTPYIIPAGYLDDLGDNILAKIIDENCNLIEIVPINPINPYQVSSKYFDGLATKILDKINGLEGREVFSQDLNKVTPYQVPVGYFNNLSSKMLDIVMGLTNEGVEVNLHFTKTNPYAVPVGYLINLSLEILNKVKQSDSEEDQSTTYFTKSNPYQVPLGYFQSFPNVMLVKVNPSIEENVPAGYFDSLPTILLQKIKGLEVKEELDVVAPLLNTVNKKPINYVPTGYFETLEPILPQATPVRIISVRKKANWFKSAIAACLIGTLGFTAYEIMDGGKPITTIQTASNEEIDIKIPKNINIDEELSKVDDDSLKDYLNNVEMPTEQATVHFNEVNSGDVDEALQDISNEAIQQHLDETGGLPDKKD